MDTLYTIADVQRVLKCGRTKAYALIASGAIASIVIGRSLRVTKKDLHAFIDENRRDG